MGLCDGVVAVSSAVATRMSMRGIADGRIHVVKNGTIGTRRRPDPSELEAVQYPGRSIVVVGAVSQRKGSDVVLDAFSLIANRYTDVHLYFVGNNDWPSVVEPYEDTEWVSRVHFEGFSASPSRYMKSAYVVVSGSRRDPFPLVLLEAREIGVPIIGPRVDGIPEALDLGKAGMLYEREDCKQLAMSLERILDDRVVRDEWAEASLSGSPFFSVSRMATDYTGVYESVLCTPVTSSMFTTAVSLVREAWMSRSPV